MAAGFLRSTFRRFSNRAEPAEEQPPDKEQPPEKEQPPAEGQSLEEGQSPAEEQPSEKVQPPEEVVEDSSTTGSDDTESASREEAVGSDVAAGAENSVSSREEAVGSDVAASAEDSVSATDHGADDEGDNEGDWLEYELHPWALEKRVMLRQLLTGDQVVHSWQGTTLLVHSSLENKVDSLITEVEEATDRSFKFDEDLTAFEMGEWSQELRDELVARLVQAGVPHRMNETEEVCDLLVRVADEERVDLVIDDLLARVEEADLTELEGLEVNDLLSALFVACDRLRRDTHDAEGVLGALDAARQVIGVRTPFGFSAPRWRALRDEAGTLLDMLESDDTDDEELRGLAHRLRDTLQMLI